MDDGLLLPERGFRRRFTSMRSGVGSQHCLIVSPTERSLASTHARGTRDNGAREAAPLGRRNKVV